jgi:hypothetical protein
MHKRTVDKIILAWIILIIIAALVGNVSVAATNSGRTAADFLQIGMGARSAAMGGAFTSISTGADAAYWNPAALAGEDHYEVTFSHFSWYQDLNLEHGSASAKLNDRFSIAGSMTYLGYGEIDGYDVDGNYVGAVSSYDWAAGLSMAIRVNDRFAVGVTGKYINQRLDDYSGSAFAGDLGLRYQFDRVTLAATATNLGTGIKFVDIEEDLPASARFGVAVRPFSADFQTALEFEKAFKGESVIRHGMEMGFEERYFIRTGYNVYLSDESHTFSEGLAFGAGLRFGVAQLDYAYSLRDQYSSEDLHRFSLTFHMN